MTQPQAAPTAHPDCQVYVDNAWRPGHLVRLAGDGWARVLVDCYGKLRELTFSPHTLRLTGAPNGTTHD